MKSLHSLVFISLFLPINSYASFKSIKEQWAFFAAWAELKYDQFIGLQPSFADLKQFKKIQDKYQSNIEKYYQDTRVFPYTYPGRIEQVLEQVNSAPDAPLPNKNIPEWIINHVHKILEQNNINPKKIGLNIMSNEEHLIEDTSAISSPTGVRWYPSYFLSDIHLKGEINHELTHIIKAHHSLAVIPNDSSEGHPEDTLLKMIRRNHQIEYEGDLFLGIHSQENAKIMYFSKQIDTLHLFFKKGLPLINPTLSHPSFMDRYRKAKQLYNFHSIKNQLKSSRMNINELINRFKAQRQEIRIS